MKFLSIKLALLLCICTIAGFAVEQGVLLENNTDKNKMNIGDNINLNISLKCPVSYKIDAPQTLPDIKGWEVRDLKKNIQCKDNVQELDLIYTLTTFTTGEVLIPPLSINYKDEKDKENEIKTREIKITVESLFLKEGDKGDIMDIKPPFYLKTSWRVYLLWIFILTLLGLAFFFWYKNYQKRHKPVLQNTNVPKIPPYKIALAELEKLKASDLLTEGRIKEFYITLSDIIRDFLSATYSIQTRDRTTGEIYQDLRRKMSDKKNLNNIKEFFEECDLVKFAKYRPDEQSCLLSWETAKNIVINITNG